MATFSLWKNFEAVKQFAYNSKQHQEAIRRTRKNDWYREELICTLSSPTNLVGTWGGKDLLDLVRTKYSVSTEAIEEMQ